MLIESDQRAEAARRDLVEQDRRRGAVARIVSRAVLARAARHQCRALRDAIGDQRFMMRLVEQMVGLARDDELDRGQVRALMEQLEHRQIGRASWRDRGCKYV